MAKWVRRLGLAFLALLLFAIGGISLLGDKETLPGSVKIAVPNDVELFVGETSIANGVHEVTLDDVVKQSNGWRRSQAGTGAEIALEECAPGDSQLVWSNWSSATMGSGGGIDIVGGTKTLVFRRSDGTIDCVSCLAVQIDQGSGATLYFLPLRPRSAQGFKEPRFVGVTVSSLFGFRGIDLEATVTNAKLPPEVADALNGGTLWRPAANGFTPKNGSKGEPPA